MLKFREKILRSLFPTIVSLILLSWAIFVMSQYLFVDESFLKKIFKAPNYLFYVSSIIFILISSIVFIYIWGLGLRKRIILGFIFLLTFGIFSFFFYQYFQGSISKIKSMQDGARVAWIIILAAFGGIGVSIGSRQSTTPLTIRGMVSFITTIFLLITLVARELSSLIILIWFFLLANEVGKIFISFLCNVIKKPYYAKKINGVVAISIGLSLLIIITLLLGIAGGTNDIGILIFLLSLSLIFLKRIIRTIKDLTYIPWNNSVDLNEFELAGLVVVFAIFLIYWIGALGPEVGADSISFRIAGPKIWLREGVIRPIPEILGSYGQFAGEMLHLLLLPIAGLKAAKVLQFGFAILLILSSYYQVFEKQNRKGRALLVGIFWGSSLIWWQMIWGFVDISQLFFYFVCFLSVGFWLDEQENPVWLIIAGISGATSTAIKLNGFGSIAFAEVTVLSFAIINKKSLKIFCLDSLYLGIPVLITMLPWLLRSYILTGNPIFPFAANLIKSPLIDELAAVHFGIGLKWPDLLAVPWKIFFNPSEFGSLGTYHPMILALCLFPIIGISHPAARKQKMWLSAGIFTYVLWLITEQNSRYSLYAFYFIFLAIGFGVEFWQNTYLNVTTKFLFQFFLLLGLVGGFSIQVIRPSFWIGATVSGTAFPYEVTLGKQTETTYLISHVRTYLCAEWFNQHYGSKGKIWEISGTDHLFFESPVISHPHGILPVLKPLNNILMDPNPDLDKIHEQLISGGYTHIIYDLELMGDSQKVHENDRVGIFGQEFEKQFLQLECADRGLRLFRINKERRRSIEFSTMNENLLVNTDFSSLDMSGKPNGWNLTGKANMLFLDGSRSLYLENNARINQSSSVIDGIPYELLVVLKAASPTSKVVINSAWYDAAGQLRLFTYNRIIPSDIPNYYRILQTPPTGVSSVIVYINGDKTILNTIKLNPIINK